MRIVERFRGQRGELMAQIRFAKRPAPDTRARQAIQTAEQVRLVTNPAHDHIGMVPVGREKGSGFQNGMAGLHDLLGMGKIFADKHINVWLIRYLRKTHDKPPLEKRKNTFASGGS